MSKASKNGTGSGGDERNMYTRSYKSTSNLSKASSSNSTLTERPSKPESSSRSKYSGSTTKPLPETGKSIQRFTVRTPVKIGSGRPTNRVNRLTTVSANKEEKKNSGIIKTKAQMTKMKQETESTEKKQKSSVPQTENKEPTGQVENNKQIDESNHVDEQTTNQQQENGSTNGINEKEEALEGNSNESETKENGKTEQNEKEISETNEKEEEFNLQLEAEENSIKPEEKESSETNKESDVQSESKTSVEEVREDSQTDVESCSVDVVESTTSEVSEATESTAPSEIKDKDTDNQDTNSDAVSYDSSIMLKDVKIKLNDCLKDKCTDSIQNLKSSNYCRKIPRLKTEEENNIDQSLPEYAHKEATFGKTLRTISGRSSIGRMRHITLRDRQPSPNSSLFVNTSGVSLSEDGTVDYKILRHRSALSELTSNNGGTPAERKRKLIEEGQSILKRPKIEEGNSLLNASFELLKYPFSGLKRPQVSTPYKFPVDKHVSMSEEVKASEPEPKKWCVIM